MDSIGVAKALRCLYGRGMASQQSQLCKQVISLLLPLYIVHCVAQCALHHIQVRGRSGASLAGPEKVGTVESPESGKGLVLPMFVGTRFARELQWHCERDVLRRVCLGTLHELSTVGRKASQTSKRVGEMGWRDSKGLAQSRYDDNLSLLYRRINADPSRIGLKKASSSGSSVISPDIQLVYCIPLRRRCTPRARKACAAKWRGPWRLSGLGWHL